MTADLLYSDTERDLVSALSSLLSSRGDAAAVLALDGPVDAGLWRAVAAELGCAGLLIPASLGGAGASYREVATAAEQLGAYVAPVPFLGSAVVATTALLSALSASATAFSDAAPHTSSSASTPGTPPASSASAATSASSAPHTPPASSAPSTTRASSAAAATAATADLLRRLAAGDATAALAVSFTVAPGTGFPASARLAGPQTGDSAAGVTRLRGRIPAVADALAADALLVPADGVPRGLYLIEVASPGVKLEPVVSLDMTRQLCDVELADAPGRLIASGGDAERAVDAALAAGAAIIAAEQVGLAQRCLDMTVSYVKERRQFARPIGSFQAIKHRLADVWAALTQARAASRYAAWCLARSDADSAVAVALAKSACSDVAVLAAQECVQLHGGIGFTWEHPAHLYLKRAKAGSLGLGTPSAHRAALAPLVNLPPPE